MEMDHTLERIRMVVLHLVLQFVNQTEILGGSQPGWPPARVTGWDPQKAFKKAGTLPSSINPLVFVSPNSVRVLTLDLQTPGLGSLARSFTPHPRGVEFSASASNLRPSRSRIRRPNDPQTKTRKPLSSTIRKGMVPFVRPFVCRMNRPSWAGSMKKADIYDII